MGAGLFLLLLEEAIKIKSFKRLKVERGIKIACESRRVINRDKGKECLDLFRRKNNTFYTKQRNGTKKDK